MLAALEAQQPVCRLVHSDVVQEEYRRHIEEVTEETLRLLYKSRDQYRRALKIIGHYRGEVELPSADDEWIETSVRRARAVTDAFVALAAVEPASNDDRLQAVQRVETATAPSRRGKYSTADCIITEVALRLARAPAAGIAKTVFFSSNTKEYCDPTGRRLKDSLQTEFAACGLEYVRSWGEAVYSVLGSEGQ